MSSNPLRGRMSRRPDQRGAAVVEAALVISFFLVPLLVGVLLFGERLWAAQKTPPYDAHLAPSEITGNLTCAELVDRVKTTLVNNAAGLPTPLQSSWITVNVIEALPTVGVLVDVKVSVPPADGTGDPLVTEAASRLDNVTLTTSTCM